MRNIVVTEFLSLDGVMEEPGWTFEYWNDEILLTNPIFQFSIIPGFHSRKPTKKGALKLLLMILLTDALP